MFSKVVRYKISIQKINFILYTNNKNEIKKTTVLGDFPGGAVDGTPRSNAGCLGSIPGQGTRSHMHAATKSLNTATKEPACRN